MARPTKYSKAMAEAICKRLQMGSTRMAASESLGIDYDTFRNWMRDNSEFFAAVTRAESECEAAMTACITKAARGTPGQPADWRAAESWLKRRRRNEWGDNISLRADRRAAELIAELFPEDAGSNLLAIGAGETETS